MKIKEIGGGFSGDAVMRQSGWMMQDRQKKEKPIFRGFSYGVSIW